MLTLTANLEAEQRGQWLRCGGSTIGAAHRRQVTTPAPDESVATAPRIARIAQQRELGLGSWVGASLSTDVKARLFRPTFVLRDEAAAFLRVSRRAVGDSARCGSCSTRSAALADLAAAAASVIIVLGIMIGQYVGQLRIVSQVGAGGMGAVFLAVHETLGLKRAIKFLLPHFTQDGEVVRRFLNEARAASRLGHRNIVQVHDEGRLDNGGHYIVFDFIEGQTLASYLQAQGGRPLPLHEIVRIVSQIANALRVAHSRGIIHRDLKLENVLATVRDGIEGHVVVVDWGIAMLGGDPGAGPQTKSGILIGTPVYMPPEQIRGIRVDAGADVYALATIAYRLATGGAFPYQFDNSEQEYYNLSPTEICLRQMARPAPDPRDRVPQLRDDFARALLTGLSLDPRQRPSPEQYALLLARAAPAEGEYVAGIDVVHAYARELLDGPGVRSLGRTPIPRTALSPNPVASARVDLHSRYTLGDRIGAGGMAEVFLATMRSSEGLQRRVVIKRVLPDYSANQDYIEMFQREATLAAPLRHQNIVAIEDFDRDSENRLFIVMEHVEGRDLSALLDTGPLPAPVAIYIVAGVLSALSYAHRPPDWLQSDGLVHRDVSPHNILLSWDGAVKLADFGVAKSRPAPGAPVPASFFIKGKPGYMSPEQACGVALDERSDLFSVGVVLWQTLVGRHPFTGTSSDDVVALMRDQAIASPRTARHEIGTDLEAVTLHLLALDPAKRYPTADAALAALLACREFRPDGQIATVQLLAERFPSAPRARSSAQDISSSAREMGNGYGVDRQTRAGRPAVLPFPPPYAVAPHAANSTLGTSGVAALAAPKRSRRWPWITAIAVSIGAAAVFLWRDSAKPADEQVATDRDAHPAAVISAQPAPPTPILPTPTITVQTEPPGALVRIDGVLYGKAPVTIPVALGRTFAVEAVHDDYEPARKTATAAAGAQTITLELRPVSSAARSSVVSQPGAQLGTPGETPARPGRRKKPPAPTPSSPRTGSGSGAYDPNGATTDPNI